MIYYNKQTYMNLSVFYVVQKKEIQMKPSSIRCRKTELNRTRFSKNLATI